VFFECSSCPWNEKSPELMRTVGTGTGGMPSLRPMLATEYPNAKLMEAVKSPEWVVEQKLDGHRVLLEVTNGRARAIGRNGQSSQHNGLFMQRAYAHDLRQLPVDCVLDGELVDDVLWVFDLPYYAEKGMEVLPSDQLKDRRAALERLFGFWTPSPSCFRLLPQATDEIAKSKLALTVLQGGGEGIMLKPLTSTYRSGLRAKDICKVKFVKTVDCVVSAVGTQGKDNYELSLYVTRIDGTFQLVKVGRCSAIGKAQAKVGDVVEVKYLYVGADDRLYQPRMMRIRTDKDAMECDITQLDHCKVNKQVFA
jgi:ATP-dependent DNA ligase